MAAQITFLRWAVLAMLTYFKYAALAVRCPPRTVNCSLIPL